MTIQNKHSDILETVVDILYPIIILYGFYSIIKGSDSPGGGFQGGAILAAIFMARFLVDSVTKLNTNALKAIEKLFFILLLLFSSFAILSNTDSLRYIDKRFYLTVMNMLIGAKVCCGISIIFFHFAFIESR